jgi:hypothetical protein
MLLTQTAKQEASDQLIDLVQTAYATTPRGSFVSSVAHVLPSDWHVMDWDSDPGLDCAVFYRGPYSREPWRGFKIQGIGHDGQPGSRRLVVERVQSLLTRPGWWIETSDAMRSALLRVNLQPVTDVGVLRRLFGDPKLIMIDRVTYQRTLTDGSKITETVFGRPEF